MMSDHPYRRTADGDRPSASREGTMSDCSLTREDIDTCECRSCRTRRAIREARRVEVLTQLRSTVPLPHAPAQWDAQGGRVKVACDGCHLQHPAQTLQRTEVYFPIDDTEAPGGRRIVMTYRSLCSYCRAKKDARGGGLYLGVPRHYLVEEPGVIAPAGTPGRFPNPTPPKVAPTPVDAPELEDYHTVVWRVRGQQHGKAPAGTVEARRKRYRSNQRSGKWAR